MRRSISVLLLGFSCCLSLFSLEKMPKATTIQQYIEPGDSFIVERGAMIAYGGRDISMQTEEVSSNILYSLYTSFWTGESVWENKFNAGEESAWVALDGSFDLVCCMLAPGEGLYSIQGSLLARDAWVCLDSSIIGSQGYFTGTGFTMQKLVNEGTKPGRVFISHAKGKTLQEIKITENDGSVFVDAANIVGFTTGLRYSSAVANAKSLWTRMVSKEFRGSSFQGKGSVFVAVGKEIPDEDSSTASSKKKH